MGEQGEQVNENTKETSQRPKDWLEQFFSYKHLPPHLQEVSAPFCELAARIVDTLPSNPERTVALRKLLEAKDCAVRALLAGPMHQQGPKPPAPAA